MKADILCLTAHPDDVELGCAGTVASAVDAGKTVVIVDLTRGELGSRGTPELRKQEAFAAAEILGVAHREILDIGDGLFEETEQNLRTIVDKVRYYQPEIVITNALTDRHPDHGRAAKLVTRACFLSALVNFHPEQEAWRPRNVFYMLQDRYAHPDLVVDISNHFDKKMEAIMAFASQFHRPDDDDQPQTPISSPEFLAFLKARAVEMGRIIGKRYGEGFNVERTPGVSDLCKLL